MVLIRKIFVLLFVFVYSIDSHVAFAAFDRSQEEKTVLPEYNAQNQRTITEELDLRNVIEQQDLLVVEETEKISPELDHSYNIFCDFNDDQILDLKDFFIFKGNYGSDDKQCDLNDDKKVDIMDFLVFKQHYATTPDFEEIEVSSSSITNKAEYLFTYTIGDTQYTEEKLLNEGINVLTVITIDENDNERISSCEVVLDSIGPQVTLISSEESLLEEYTLQYSVDGQEKEEVVCLDKGINVITKEFVDIAGNTSSVQWTITLSQEAPDLIDDGIICMVIDKMKDAKLDRSDILNILSTVISDDRVSQAEYDDLNKIHQNAEYFNMTEAQKYLLMQTVGESYYNNKVLGEALGNLVAETENSSYHLQKLIDKWYFGKERPTPVTDYGSGTYAEVQGQLFVDGISYTDIIQGVAGDCYFLATLSALAFECADYIYDLIIDNKDATYTVRIEDYLKEPVYITVDSFLPVNSSGELVFASMGRSIYDSNIELWVALIEKAYAIYRYNGNSYDSIGSGYAAWDGFAPLGFTSTTIYPSSSTIESFLCGWADNKTALTAGSNMSFGSALVSSDGIFYNHVYSIIDYNADRKMVELWNPHGTKIAVSLNVFLDNFWILDYL